MLGVQEEKSSEATENLVILHMAASLNGVCSYVCVRACVCFGEGLVSRKGLCLSNLFPLPCGRKNHWLTPSQIPEDMDAGLENRSRPQGGGAH